MTKATRWVFARLPHVLTHYLLDFVSAMELCTTTMRFNRLWRDSTRAYFFHLAKKQAKITAVIRLLDEHYHYMIVPMRWHSDHVTVCSHISVSIAPPSPSIVFQGH